MKHQILHDLMTHIAAPAPIKERIRSIKILREQLEATGELTHIEIMEINFATKGRIQREASNAIDANGGNGVVLIATGGGKSKIAVNRIRDFVTNDILEPKFLIVVPTQKLRDTGWRDEFAKWNATEYYAINVETVCYDSLTSIKGRHFDCVYFDEIHNITEAHVPFFDDNSIRNKVAFTATRPRDQKKLEVLRAVNLFPVYEITLDEAVDLGLVAPYDITIVEVELDNIDKCIKAGNTTKSWMQTELAAYSYANSRILNANTPTLKKLATLSRMRLVYETKSKTDAAKYLLDNIIPKEQRTLIFSGGINQALQLCENRYYSKPSIGKGDRADIRAAKQIKIDAWRGTINLERFEKEEINRLACVSSLNEGHNIDNLDNGFMPQIDSNQLNFIQRLGRVVRFRAEHIGRIIVLCAKNTVDEKWVNSAILNLSVLSVRRVSLEDLKSGKETISFTN